MEGPYNGGGGRKGRNTFGSRFQKIMENVNISSIQLGLVVEVKH
jgi:hypothetical protein